MGGTNPGTKRHIPLRLMALHHIPSLPGPNPRCTHERSQEDLASNNTRHILLQASRLLPNREPIRLQVLQIHFHALDHLRAVLVRYNHESGAYSK